MMKIYSYSILAVLVTAGISLAGPSLTNGNFSDGLNGWTIEEGPVYSYSEQALLEENGYPYVTSMSQSFTLHGAAETLSFDIDMNTMQGTTGSSQYSDAFAAYLLDPVDYSPLISNPGFSEFYYLENNGFEETVGTVSGNTVELDVTSIAGQDVYLAFDLYSEDDGLITSVFIDNVMVAPAAIPAPAALLLCGIGLAAVRHVRS